MNGVFAFGCCDCFGRSHKSSSKKTTPTDASTLVRRFSQEKLLGLKIEELGKASMGKGGRPASKSPLTSAAASSTNGKAININGKANSINGNGRGHNDADLHIKGGMKVSKSTSHLAYTSPRPPIKETTRANRQEVQTCPSSAVCLYWICRQADRDELIYLSTPTGFLVKDSDGNKTINEFVRERKIGTGSYGKVVLHRSKRDNQLYAIKIFHKSRLRKLRVAPAETAMMDVLREVAIMKKLDHPNIVPLLEVIDDPDSDYFYMVLEYVAGGWIFEGSGPPGGIDADVARRYFADVVAGLTYLHKHNIVHGDIKPENLLISKEGRIKICDFGVSHLFTDGNDALRRSPGTPVYTAPECCLGVTYHGRAADIWALGCTLYCMILGRYPFVGSTLQATYELIVNDEFWYPTDMDPDLLDLLRRLLCKDPKQRLTLEAVAHHPWMAKGPPGPLLASSI